MIINWYHDQVLVDASLSLNLSKSFHLEWYPRKMETSQLCASNTYCAYALLMQTFFRIFSQCMDSSQTNLTWHFLTDSYKAAASVTTALETAVAMWHS